MASTSAFNPGGPGGLVRAMSQLRSVCVDRQARLADVDSGCTLGDVDAATQKHGLATVPGVDSEAGGAAEEHR